MQYEFLCVAIDPEEIHQGDKLIAEWRTVTLMAKNVGGNGKGGAVGGFQLPLMEVSEAAPFEVGKPYLLSIQPK